MDFSSSYLTQLFRWHRNVLNRVVVASSAAVFPDAYVPALRPISGGALVVVRLAARLWTYLSFGGR
jgi:hypothetical protein